MEIVLMKYPLTPVSVHLATPETTVKPTLMNVHQFPAKMKVLVQKHLVLTQEQVLVKMGELVLTASVHSPVYVHLATPGNLVKVAPVFAHRILASMEASALNTLTTTGAIARAILTDLIASTIVMYVAQIPVNMVAHASTRARISTPTCVSVLVATLGTTAKIQVTI